MEHTPPQGKYRSAALGPGVVVSAGMTPRDSGRLICHGEVGSQVSVDQARQAAALATRNALVAMESEVPPGKRMSACLSATVYIRAGGNFDDHAKVADAASEAICEHLGPQAMGARVAVGVASLPGGAPVEVQLIGLLADVGAGVGEQPWQGAEVTEKASR
jgi:enamine deaminase RidA (YjgF/YER057c/UK114 family)